MTDWDDTHASIRRDLRFPSGLELDDFVLATAQAHGIEVEVHRHRRGFFRERFVATYSGPRGDLKRFWVAVATEMRAWNRGMDSLDGDLAEIFGPSTKL